MRRKDDDSTRPREGDTLVTLECDIDHVVERQRLLAYSFAKVVQGAVLRQIVRWDLGAGCIQFIVGGGAANPGPRGGVRAKLDDVPPELTMKVERCDRRRISHLDLTAA